VLVGKIAIETAFRSGELPPTLPEKREKRDTMQNE
jgi:hypothetical protein